MRPDDQLSDRELPDDADLDASGDDPDETDLGDPCPECGKAIYHDAVRCPNCGHYRNDEENTAPTPRGWWKLILLAAVALAMLLLALMGTPVIR